MTRRSEPCYPDLTVAFSYELMVYDTYVFRASAYNSAGWGPGIQPRATGYTWSWSDGASGTRRTFSERQYGSASRLPKLIVRSDCSTGARIGDRIKLQWRNNLGKYRTEDSAYVDSCRGRYRLSFYPYASNGAWARGTYQYRLIVPGGGGYKYFMITYTRR